MGKPRRAPKKLKQRLLEVINSRNLSHKEINENLVEKVRKKVGVEGLQKIVKNNHGAKVIRAQLKNQLNQKDIGDVKNVFDEEFHENDAHLMKNKFCFPYRGAWFFDLIVNHKYKDNPKDNLVKYFGVFLNGNSGWVKAFEINQKSASEIHSKFDEFIDYCRTIKYPVKTIISDNEGGVPNTLPGVNIIKKTQSGTSHITLARINAFASALRRYHEAKYRDLKESNDESRINSKYITTEDLEDFIDVWNNSMIPVINATRQEVMDNVDLEEAYIAAAMSKNQEIQNAVSEAFKPNDIVRVQDKRETNIFDKNNPIGTYRIISNVNGDLKLENVNNPKDVIMSRAMNIKGRVIRGEDKFNKYLESHNLTLPTEQPKPKQAVVRTQPTESNKEEATVYKNTKTVSGAREVLDINKGKKQADAMPNTKPLPKYEPRMTRSRARAQAESPNLTQQERTEIAKRIVEEEEKANFNLGFLSNYTPAEKYRRMTELIKNIPAEYEDLIFGETSFYEKKKNYNEIIEKMKNKIQPLFKNENFLYVWNTVMVPTEKDLSRFEKNKPGRKVK